MHPSAHTEGEDMTTISTEAGLSYDLVGAQCKGTGRWWSRIEATCAAARSVDRRNEAAAPAMSLCADCPVRAACATWARAAAYTGIAGGAYLYRGSELTPRGLIELADAA